jgi:hypothetical protein
MGTAASELGICKLCLKKKPLQRGHLIPAAAWRAMRGPSFLPRGPIAITSRITMAAPRDITANFLCRDCEQLFSRKGENWVLKRICKDGRFPLLDRLRVAIPIGESDDSIAFSGPDVGFQTEKLAYFAVSMIWRASVYPWKLHDGTSATIDIGAIQEECRKYLVGSASFPKNLYVVAIICSDLLSQYSAHQPVPVEREFPAFGFLVCGLFIAVLLGETVPDEDRCTCCYTSSRQPIFVKDRSRHAINNVSRLRETTRLARALTPAK